MKKVYDEPKPHYLRILDSPELDQGAKKDLSLRARHLHIVKQKRLVDQGVG